MPGVYKEKVCPKCDARHRRRGPHCSQSCANMYREATESMRKNMHKVATAYNRTPEAIAKLKLIQTGVSIEDFGVGIPTLYDLPEGYEEMGNW